MHFIREHQDGGVYVYREQLKNNSLRGLYYICFELLHLSFFDEVLAQAFRNQPSDFIKVFETAVATIYKNDYYDEMNPNMDPLAKFQVQVKSEENPMMLREMQSNLVGKLVCVPGIITATRKTNIRAKKAVFRCSNCGCLEVVDVGYGLRKITAPAICRNRQGQNGERNNCPLNPFKFDADASEFFDQQMMTLQEAPELIPTGEMPRSLLLTCDRSLTDKCTPGNRVKIVGVLTITKK